MPIDWMYDFLLLENERMEQERRLEELEAEQEERLRELEAEHEDRIAELERPTEEARDRQWEAGYGAAEYCDYDLGDTDYQSYSADDELQSTTAADEGFRQWIESVPKTLDQWVWQPRLRDALKPALQAAKEGGVPLGHMLFCGPYGCGKAALAYTIAYETYCSVHPVSGASSLATWQLEQILAAPLGPAPPKMILIEYVDTATPALQDHLLQRMEDLKDITIIGTTDEPCGVRVALLQQFGGIYTFDPYDAETIRQAVLGVCVAHALSVEYGASCLIASAAGGDLWKGRRLAERVCEYAEDIGAVGVTQDLVYQAMLILGLSPPATSVRHSRRTREEGESDLAHDGDLRRYGDEPPDELYSQWAAEYEDFDSGE